VECSPAAEACSPHAVEAMPLALDAPHAACANATEGPNARHATNAARKGREETCNM
jgi:hypothetical protein